MSCCNKGLEFIDWGGGPEFMAEKAECDCGAVYFRKRGTDRIYKTLDKGTTFTCIYCNSIIQSVQVSHSIHDGPSPLSGHGEVVYEQVPYCPKCEKKPESNGLPIRR
jgi:hypothetical protein